MSKYEKFLYGYPFQFDGFIYRRHFLSYGDGCEHLAKKSVDGEFYHFGPITEKKDSSFVFLFRIFGTVAKVEVNYESLDFVTEKGGVPA